MSSSMLSDAPSDRRPSDPSLAGDRPQPRNLESTRAVQQTAKSPLLGPQTIRPSKTKKPGMPRRTSSAIPHRGQEFSVDDDASEIEGMVRQTGPQGATLRRKPSTLKRRPTLQVPTLPRVVSGEVETTTDLPSPSRGDAADDNRSPGEAEEEQETMESPEQMEEDDSLVSQEEDGDISDAESFTLKDRQEAINETHPFGIRIWKPALYKKNRSVQKTAEGDIHSSPGGRVSRWLLFFNCLWTVLFGWWLAAVALAGALACFIFALSPSAIEYGRVLWGLSGYLFYPFGKFVRLEQDEAYADEDEGEGRTIVEYEQWQSGDLEDGRLFFGPQTGRSIIGRSRRSIDSTAADETDSLLGRMRRGGGSGSRDRDSSGGGKATKRRLFGRGQWNLGRVIFFVFFYGLITPLLFLVSGICWFLVFLIPMGRVTILLLDHLRRHPLALSFESDSTYSRHATSNSSILLCTYRAVGTAYWKYTIDGTNIFLVNLMAVVLFVIFDYFVLDEMLGLKIPLTSPGFLFIASLFSIIPLAYFIGQAVASISAQSSMGLGAAINAFFSTLVEVFLYCIALKQGKGQLVEGSIIGSIFAGILFLPGLSMCFGALKRKTQRFNAKSAGVTSTMLLFGVIAAFSPTLFYQIYGTHELQCLDCVETGPLADASRDCRRCYFSQVPALDDRFYLEAVRPYCWFASTLLFLSYIIGLWFTLRTHAAVIWDTTADEKKEALQESHHHVAASVHHYDTNSHPARLQRQPTLGLSKDFSRDRDADIRDSQLYKRILGQSLKQVGLNPREEGTRQASGFPFGEQNGSQGPPHIVPPKSSGSDKPDVQIPGFSEAQNTYLVREVAEMAATAATIAARDATRTPRRVSATPNLGGHRAASTKGGHVGHVPGAVPEEPALIEPSHEGGGHDAPNWSRAKSSVILCGATVLYAMIAEILVNTVDVVLEGAAIDEKFLGITLFALVPNTTEFLVSRNLLSVKGWRSL